MEKNIKVFVTGGAGYLGSWLVKELLQRGYTVHATLRNLGGAGYLGSWLVKELLQKGYTVHATLRNLGNQSKVGLLKGLPHADTRLQLFKADIYNADEFAHAIQGCEVVIHVATPMHHNPESSQYKNTSEAAAAGAKSIVESCIRSGTVKRVVYTASVAASSPLKDDGSGFKDSIDETCWTPPNVSVPIANDFFMDYTLSKTTAEKEVMSYQGSNVEVVSLACGVVGGETLLSSVPASLGMLVTQIKGDHIAYSWLRFIEELLGKIPILHIEDVIAAHIFCMENSVPSGRYLCANGYLKTAEIAAHYLKHHPDVKIAEEFVEDKTRVIRWGSTKLEDLGFHYKYDVKMTLDETLRCARRMGYLN